MARLRRFDLDELATRPGTYFNPETEILIVVDDSTIPARELADDSTRGEWILVGDEVPLDEPSATSCSSASRSAPSRAGERDEVDDDEVVEEEEELEPDPDPDEY